jgi:hypothetical protein
MPSDSDVALLGTGVAPLIAAQVLSQQGKSVLILNPDRDFFLEDSELPLDPLLSRPTAGRIQESGPDRSLGELRPHFPGAVEFWSPDPSQAPSGFHDASAPHVRSRDRLWIASPQVKSAEGSWPRPRREDLEELYVEFSDAGLKPTILDGIQAVKRFPGHSSSGPAGGSGDAFGLLVPRVCDVDVSRYRNGLLEFVRERLGEDRVVRSATQIEPMPEGIRYHSAGGSKTARVRDGILVFWTPRLTRWVLSQAKHFEVAPVLPLGIRLWEQWALRSRDPIDPGCVGSFGDLAVWGDTEGSPLRGDGRIHELAVLRPGKLVPIDSVNMPESGMSWAGEDSFASLVALCTGFMRWEKFTIDSMRPRAVFEWENKAAPWKLTGVDPAGFVVPRCDGPLFQVVEAAKEACGRIAPQ